MSEMGAGGGLIRAPRLVTVRGEQPPRRGVAAGSLHTVPDGALAWREGVITFAGRESEVPAEDRDLPSRDLPGAVLPGFVDCHTHLPFFGWRPEEFEARLAGSTYRDLHDGGGIFRSARLLAAASDDEVLGFCLPLATEMLEHGTTALELKTGYGLSVEAELRQLALARELAGRIPQTASVTLLACHAVPPEGSREDWVDAVCERLIPAVAEAGLADAVDVYVEDIAFTVEDLTRVAHAAGDHGLPVRCHADQLGPSGAAEAAVALGARTADHLNHVGPAGIAALAAAPGTAAVLLPTSTLFLGADPPPVSELVAEGCAIALATDFNPGTSPCLSMPEVIAAAAALYRLPVAVSLGAATINGAWALGLDGALGSLEAGKRADFLVLESEDAAMIPYRPGHNPVVETWVAGRRVFSRS